MKNYYEILEVDKNASIEVIDKAYRVLAKKYHPDMNNDNQKDWAENQFKKINEAYEILSDENKRKEYNHQLETSTIDYSKKYQELCKQQELLKQELQTLKNRYKPDSNPSRSQSVTSYYNDIYAAKQIHYKKNINSDIENIRKQEFNQAYQNILHNLGYTIRKKKTFKDFLAFALTIILITTIIYILWNIPFTKNYLINFYESNEVLKGIINLFKH